MNGFFSRWGVALLVLAASSAQSQPAPDKTEVSTLASSSNDAEIAALIAAQRFAEAFPLVERRVMLHPDDVAAWLDYALVVRALGRIDESREVLAFIERELSPDARTQRLMAALAPMPQPSSLPRHQWRGEISLLSGRESNANAGPSVRGLTFNIPGESPVTLELAPQSLPQPSSSHLLEARLESSHILGQGVTVSTLVDWRQRNTPDFRTAGSRQWQADAVLTFGGSETMSSTRQWLLVISTLDYDYGGSTLFQRQRLAAGVDQRFALQSTLPCRLQGTLEREWRHHPAQNGLISDMNAIQLAGVCAHGRHRWTLMTRIGKDRARGERPGGTQTRQDIAIGYRTDLSTWGQIEMQASHAYSRDAEFYNALFGDIRRRLARNQLNLSYASTLFHGHWQVIARAEVFHQRANIGLFRLRGHSAHVGLRYTF